MIPRIRASLRCGAGADPCEVLDLRPDGAVVTGAADGEVTLEVGGAALAATVVDRHDAGGRPVCVLRFDAPASELRPVVAAAIAQAWEALGSRVLGRVRGELQRAGVTDLTAIAEEVRQQRDALARLHLFGPDLYTESGSDVEAALVSRLTGERQDCVVWSLNLYLGLNREPRVIDAARAALLRYGTGCGTSAPSGGMSALHHAIEVQVAEMVGKPRAMLFTTGYAANLGALSALPGPRDLVLLDREAHASMFDGVRMSGRKYLAFEHNDVADLEEKLARFAPHHDNIFVVVESAYSMSGDLAPLAAIAALKDRHRFLLYVDEAHTFGFYGDEGRGLCQATGVTERVDFIMSTFSKSTASSGGFIATTDAFCALLQATSTPYIFQACLTPPDAATILAALAEIRERPHHAARLHENNRLMRAMLTAEGFDLGTSESPVIPVYVRDLPTLYKLCAELYLDGIFSVPVTWPAVGLHEGRIRFIVNAHHQRAHIERTVRTLTAHARALGVVGQPVG